MKKILLAGAALMGMAALATPAFAQARSESATSDAPAAANTRARIAPGQSVTGNVGAAGDADWFRAQLAAGESYRVTLRTAEGDNGLGDPYLRVLNSSGEELFADDDGGGNLNSYLEFIAPSRGVYYLEAKAFGDQATGRYTLTLAQGEIPGDATTDVMLDAQNGTYRSSTLSPAGDRDWYRLELTEGQTGRIALLSGEGADALGDPYVAVYDSSGAQIASDDDGGDGLNAYLEFTAPAAGLYFVEARGFSDDAVGAYTLNYTPGEVGGEPSGADAISAGGEPRVSQISPAGDRDAYAIDMIEGRTYRFNLVSVEGDGGLSDPYLSLVDSENAQIAADDDGGTGLNAYLSFTAPTSSTYYAVVSAFGDSGSGRYELRVSDTEVPGNQGTDEYLSLTDGSDSRISRIDMPGDKDWFRVELQAGQQYGITLNAYGPNPLGDPLVTVYSESGEQIASDDDSGAEGMDSLLLFTPQQSGGFYIEASGFGQSLGEYELTVGPPPPPPTPPAPTRRR